MSLLKPNLSAQLSEFIAQPAFPCAGAKTALTKDQVHVKQYDDLSCEMNNIDMLSDIYDFIHQFNMEKDIYSSLVFTFELPEVLNETVFDKLLWRKLQQLHEIDACINDWDENVANDPHHPNFSFSLGGCAFFIIGLHPAASRKSRRFSRPALVFNLHAQFEALKVQGKFTPLRDHIREQDAIFCGSKNTLLDNHGESSEALQYSGKQQPKNWQCPFHAASN